MAEPEEFARLLVDEQTAFLRRVGASWAGTAGQLRRLADGEIDGAALGRSLAEDAARNAVLAVESVARVGVGYSRFVAAVLDGGGASSTRPSSTAG